ncbi:MAG: bifunctional precorrin-2 dehydrogenase/sirohydrochlorin ferrochelatase [Desulfovibrio sp.]|jgi:precorrin-2 dehydrogenase/sirohydrochlorin ferrochelatase|nr:bifunctional precorrin-2 dehydrogenase/sirohydrochlorin ferrochelatase [Desulfovibrio sp.]
MRFFPLYIDLSAKKILIVGAGRVGQRKMRALLAARPQSITLLDPNFDPRGIEIFSTPGLICLPRAFTPEDLEDKDLVFAASSDPPLNARIAALCAERKILCNCASGPAAGDCIMPAHFYSEGICLAVGTEGQSPALAKRLREDLEAYVASRYAGLLALLGKLRAPLLELGLGPEADAEIFRALVFSPLAECLEKGEKDKAGAILREILPTAMKARAGEFLYGF